MTITFGKKTLFSLLLGLDLLANILELTRINVLDISTFLSFCTCILLPGFLISLILRIRKISFWENLLLIVGLSLAFLEFGGLLLNILFPLFGINNPLAFQNLVIGFDIYGLLLFIFAWIRTKQLVVQMQLPKRSTLEKVLYTLPIFFPILATLGAIVLNNGGSNILTMILLGAIAFYTLLLVLLRNKISVDLYPYAIFFIGMACLFITSLRGWYISGHDVEREFYIFQITNQNHLWNMAFYEDPYNACLSITILPTILTNLLSIQDMYIYKVIFQILFATSPVLVFFIAKKYTTPVFAFLSAFLFIAFPTFFTDMAMLNRQEIGFIFFGLVVYVMLERSQAQKFYPKSDTISVSGLSKLDTVSVAAVSPDLSKLDTVSVAAISPDLSKLDTVSVAAISPDLSKLDTVSVAAISPDLSLQVRRILFIIFALSVVVSHYSTNFVLLWSITFIYVLTLITSLPFAKKSLTSLLSKSRIILKSKVFLSLPLILIVFGMTYFWNNLYTHSANDAGSVLLQVVSSIFVQDSNVSDPLASYSVLFAPKTNPNQVLQEYIQSIIDSSKSSAANNNQFYSQAIINKYPIHILPQEQLPPTPLGQWLSSFHIPVSSIQADLKSLCAYLMQILVFIGVLSFFFFKNKKLFAKVEKSFDLQFLFLCMGSILLLVLITVLPALSVSYGVLRMFQQFLFILALPIVLGINSIFFFVKEQKRIIFTGIISLLLFLNLIGFISHLTGEYSPVMYLDNSGFYYNAYYVRKSDVYSLVWLEENRNASDPVQANIANTNIELAYGHIFALDGILPEVIKKNAYVFLQISVDRVVIIRESVISYSSPQLFLDDNKNLIYNNGQDNIYR